MKLFSDFANFVRRLIVTSPKRRQELEEAKKLFYSNDCNYYGMLKDGESKKYDQYRVGRIRENRWRDEFVAYWLEIMSKKGFNTQALWHIRNTGSTKSIPFLVDMAKKGDSYAKYWIANTIWSLSKDLLFGNSQGRSAAIEFYEELVQSKIIIAEKHKSEMDQKLLDMWGVKTQEEYILHRAKQDLASIRKR